LLRFNILLFLAVFYDSATNCTTVTLIDGKYYKVDKGTQFYFPVFVIEKSKDLPKSIRSKPLLFFFNGQSVIYDHNNIIYNDIGSFFSRYKKEEPRIGGPKNVKEVYHMPPIPALWESP